MRLVPLPQPILDELGRVWRTHRNRRGVHSPGLPQQQAFRPGRRHARYAT